MASMPMILQFVFIDKLGKILPNIDGSIKITNNYKSFIFT